MKIIILLTLSMLMTSHAYNILIVNTVPTRSHFILTYGVAEALVEGGHEVTLVTPYPSPKAKKKVKQIHASAVVDVLKDADDNDLGFSSLLRYIRQFSQAVINNPEVRKTLIDVQFDAVITDWFYSDFQDAGFAAVQQVPWIILSAPFVEAYLESMVDTARSIPTVAIMYNSVKEPMNFWHRIVNTFWHAKITFEMYQQQSVSEVNYLESFGPIAKARGITLPPFSEVKYNISLVLVNSHPPVAPVKSVPPIMVQIGGYHIPEEIPPLPKDLEEILNQAKTGVIYFSFGSYFKSASLPNQVKVDLVQLFGRLPYTVLWKYEDSLDNLPKNLHIRPWMPQWSILAHPNVKVFITHSGMLSTLESYRFGVPTVCVPTFGDQYINALRSEQSGLGIKVDRTDNMVKDIEVALRKILADDSYQKRAKYLSSIFNNRPVSPSRLILHHVEQAIHTKGSYHLRSSALLYKWYEVWMLDQIAFFSGIIYTLYKLVEFIVNKIRRGISNNTRSIKKQQ